MADAHIGFRPGEADGPPLPPGVSALGLHRERDTLVRVPARGAAGAPLLIVLHGAGSRPAQGLALLEQSPEAEPVLIVAPQSRRATWDVITGQWGPDVASIERVMREVAGRHPVDPARIAIAGFSDGASYALSLGLANGELFGAILAWSPGFAAPPRAVGRPRVFISHGTGDQVLPVDACSRRIVPRLQLAGYDVRYREFDGGHTVPAAMVSEALSWWLG